MWFYNTHCLAFPIPFRSLDILFNQRVAALHLDEGEFSKGFDGVPMLHRDNDGISGLYLLFLTIENKYAFALHECPDLGTVVVNLIADVLAGFERNALGETMAAIGSAM